MQNIQMLPGENKSKYTIDGHAQNNEQKLQQTVLKYSPDKLQHMHLISVFRQCNRCPLGERTKKVMQGKNEVQIVIPAVCSYYKKDLRECPVSKNTYSVLLKQHYEIISSPEFITEMGKLLIQHALADGAMSRETEVIDKGRPGFYTNQHEERAIKVLDVLGKIKIGGEKHLHLHADEDLAERLVREVIGTEVSSVVDIQAIDVKVNKEIQTTIFEVKENGN